MSDTNFSYEPAVFDLDEDSVPEVVAFDSNADGVVDVAVFDLDEDSVPDAVAVDTDADGVADQSAGFEPFDIEEAAPFDEQDWTPEEGGRDLSEDSVYTPPDDITYDDLENAHDDVEHTQVMGQYMQSRGVI